jgi:hypothetical protein
MGEDWEVADSDLVLPHRGRGDAEGVEGAAARVVSPGDNAL